MWWDGNSDGGWGDLGRNEIHDLSSSISDTDSEVRVVNKGETSQNNSGWFSKRSTNWVGRDEDWVGSVVQNETILSLEDISGGEDNSCLWSIDNFGWRKGGSFKSVVDERSTLNTLVDIDGIIIGNIEWR